MGLYTLRFTDYPTAKDAATALGFWDTDLDVLKTSGQSQREDGSWYGWAIDDIGQDPVVNEEVLEGYFVNVTGELPPPALAYLAPDGYGCAGRVFAGTEPGPHA